MNKIDKAISDIDKVICENISKFAVSDRGFASQNILQQLRHLVEHTALKEYCRGQDLEISWDNIQAAIMHVRSRGDLRFLSKFHDFLQVTVSHYTLDEENSERLMLKYYEYLLKIKSLLKTNHELEVLNNIDEFPVKIDSALKEYYEKIVEKIKQPETSRQKNPYNDMNPTTVLENAWDHLLTLNAKYVNMSFTGEQYILKEYQTNLKALRNPMPYKPVVN